MALHFTIGSAVCMQELSEVGCKDLASSENNSFVKIPFPKSETRSKSMWWKEMASHLFYGVTLHNQLCGLDARALWSGKIWQVFQRGGGGGGGHFGCSPLIIWNLQLNLGRICVINLVIWSTIIFFFWGGGVVYFYLLLLLLLLFLFYSKS